MTKRDEKILASIGMTMDEVDSIAEACEKGDDGMWDTSKISYGSPVTDEMEQISIRLPKSRINALKRAVKQSGVSRSEFIRRAIDQKLLTT